MNSFFKKYFSLISSTTVLVVSFLFLNKKINLYTADIGRHIKNGEFVFKDTSVLFTNFYSYTQPNFTVLNHHWFYGVYNYFLYFLGGFTLVSIFNGLTYAFAILFLFKTLKLKFNTFSSALAVFLLFPFFVTRTEVRPETTSFLFFSISLYLINKYLLNQINIKTLYSVFIPLQIVWINTHIFFIFNLLLLGVLFLHLLVNKSYKTAKSIFFLGVLTLAVSFINPFTYKAVLEPLNIFKQYGYMLVENQSLLFMQKRFWSFIYFYFEAFLFLFFVTFLILLKSKKIKENTFYILTLLAFAILSIKFNRASPLFAFTFAPLLTFIISKFVLKAFKGAIVVLCCFIFILPTNFSPLYKGGFGVGLMPKTFNSKNFFDSNKIAGPIFNNYDIGGYLIFTQFDKEKVFVDNRPEAYPVAFFKDTYIPMQLDPKKFKKVDGEYNFNVIYFYRYDLTPWGQEFLVGLINNTDWVPVYVDNYCIIFVKDVLDNKYIIDKYKLDKSIFSVKKNN